MGTRIRKFRFSLLIGVLLLLAGVWTAVAAQINTSGRCTKGVDCDISNTGVTGVTIRTDGAVLNLESVTADTLTLTTPTSPAIFQGADAAGSANTIFDTTGAGSVTLGSADVLTLALINNGAMQLGASTTNSIVLESAGTTSVVAAGGTVTIDGFVQGQVPVVSQTAGAIVMNTVTLATAAGDYTIADDVCAVAADVGNWFTLINEDASVVVVINPLDAVDQLFIPGVDIAAGDEADSISTAAYEGAHITMVCMAINQWYATSATTEADGSTFWADGGSS